MELNEQLDKLQEFFEKFHLDEILKQTRQGHEFVKIDFNSLAKFNPDLAQQLLEQPEEILKACQTSMQRIIDDNTKNITTRFFNLPNSQSIAIKHIRAKHISKLIELTGIVRQKSDVRPQVTKAKFECPSCGNTIDLLQLETKFREPTSCTCGRKGKFRLLGKELVDAQKLTLEEAPEDLAGGEQPKRLNIFLKNDLVSPLTEKKTNPGGKIIVSGIIKEVPIPSPDGGKLTTFDLIKEANYLEPVQEDFFSIELNPEQEEKIINLSKKENINDILVESVAPSIYGHEKIKEALILQMLGGVRKERSDGVVTRGDIHILLIGDPGSGKSQMLKRVSHIAPKSRFVSGKGASGAGLTASVVKDEFLRGFALEAGAMVLANHGICCIDELDKMTKEDTSAMHESLEQQTVTIAKANIHATLRCETTVLAAANPKWGRFDPYELLAKQIELPSTLINRFDLIFPIRDLPNAERDGKMANFILGLHKSSEDGKVELKFTNKELLETDDVKRYIAYAKQKCKPQLTKEALDEIQNYYVSMRSQGTDEGEGIKAIPISARQLEALIRLSEASAKTRLSKTVTVKDAKRAIDLVHYCLSQIGLDPETGKFDIDRISTGVPASQRGNIAIVREIINELEEAIGKAIPEEDILREAENKGMKSDEVDEILEKLKRKGDIFSPKTGIISKL